MGASSTLVCLEGLWQHQKRFLGSIIYLLWSSNTTPKRLPALTRPSAKSSAEHHDSASQSTSPPSASAMRTSQGSPMSTITLTRCFPGTRPSTWSCRSLSISPTWISSSARPPAVTRIGLPQRRESDQRSLGHRASRGGFGSSMIF